jgi:hypothetical protein
MVSIPCQDHPTLVHSILEKKEKRKVAKFGKPKQIISKNRYQMSTTKMLN